MNWVYSTEAEKPKQVIVTEQMDPTIGYSSRFGLCGSTTPQQTASPLLPRPFINEVEYLEINQSSLDLTIFMAEVDVELSEKMLVELRRSVKKNPPHALKYELIYVCYLPYKLLEMPNMLSRLGKMSIVQARKGVPLGTG